MLRFFGQSRRRTIVLAVAALLTAAGVFGALFATHGGGNHAARKGQKKARPGLRTVLTRTGLAPGSAGAPGQVGVGSGKSAPQYVPGKLIVRFDPGTSAAVANTILDQAGAHVEEKVGKLGIRVVVVSPSQTLDALKEVASATAVDYVERDVAVHSFETPNDSLWSDQWGPRVVAAPRAWDTSRGSKDIVIAVLDTGIAAHPDLQGRVLPGYDFINGDNDPTDDNGHGTAAAGVIAANTNNTRGQAGICWRCSLMPVKVLGADGAGDDSTVAQGIVWATDHGARVISMSLGGVGTTETLAAAIRYATSKDVIVVGAAGNSGTTAPTYPAAYPNVLSVAATTQSDALYSWSNRGSWVQLAAPGCDTAPWNDGGYVNFCGTSAATPVVAGLVGLALSAKPGATAAEVTAAIRRTALPVGDVQFGRVNAARVVEALAAKTTPSATTSPAASASSPATPSPPAVDGTSTQTFRGTVSKSDPLKTILVQSRGGKVAAELTFAGTRALDITLVDLRGRAVAHIAGQSPLRLSTDVSQGDYRLLIRGPRKRQTRFVLRLSHSVK